MLFNPSREEVRLFFCTVYAKMLGSDPHRLVEAAGLSEPGLLASQTQQMSLSPIEEMAARWIAVHPEYHALLASPDGAHRDFPVEAGETNPFLHLAMHLSLEEQISIDQPPGVRSAIEQLIARTGDRHAAMHLAMDCLAEMIWQAQRQQTEPQASDYLACLHSRAPSTRNG